MIKVYQTWSYAEAQYRVHISNNKSSADLFVHTLSNQAMASGNGLWFVTANYREANRRILFCERASAELVIYFVKSAGEAGWQKSHRFQGSL